MAKFRFPGKALKLNSRKRVKFRIGEDGNLDEHRISQIKAGLLLFNESFGYSDEDEDEEEFEGFENPYDKTVVKKTKKITKKSVVIEDEVEERSCDHQTNSSIDNNYDSDNENEGDTCLSIAINGLYENASKREAVILKNNQMCKVDEGDPNSEIVTEKSKDSKKVKENSERTSRKFVLPSVSARSSRIIKPNKRLFSDFALTCSTNQREEESKIAVANESSIEQSSKLVNRSKLTTEHESEEEEDDVKENDPVCRSITFYTDSITEEFKGQVGRPPKRLLRKGETQSKEEQHFVNLSPFKDLKEDKVKEKIEKLLRSPWDNRIKQNAKGTGKERDNGSGGFPLSNTTKSILRKPRLNLNNQTLQKIRNPASVQHLVPLSEDEVAENKCGLCQIQGCNTICRYGVSCCDTCSMSINFFSESLSTNLDCIGGQGECQLVGLSLEERCLACWLARILVTCAMPGLLHDRLRNSLSSTVRDRIPSSLGRSCNAVSASLEDTTGDGKGDNSVRNFGSLVDLPGGWKRKNGGNVVVISPSGEKFRSVCKLEEYLKRQGINAQASVLFGNLNPNASLNIETKVSTKQSVKPQSKISNVVVTTLPGGWTRRIKWRSTGDMFDTYVGSPDGRTFRSRKELSAYFQHIGKVDDIYKYFPVKTSRTSCENSDASSTEPVSSSEESVDDKSPHISDSEGEVIVANVNHLHENSLQKKLSESFEKSSEKDAENPYDDEETCANEEYKLEEKSEKVIISNFHSHLKSSKETSNSIQDKKVSAPDLDHTSIELSNISGKEETTLSSSYDSESDMESSGINLNLFRKKPESESSNLILKIKNVMPPESGESGKESIGGKHKKKKKKKKRKHEKHTKDKRKNSENERNLALVCDVDKIHMKVTEDAESSSSQLITLNNDLNSCTNIPWHPNDTWQTLINPNLTSGSNVQNNTDRSTNDDELEDKAEADVTSTVLPKIVKKSKKQLLKHQPLPRFTREQFGNGWGRKIKWNETGQGKVAFLTSPEGQRIVSSIELLAYFNKSGRTMLNIDHYFPKNLTRPISEEKESAVEVSNEDALERLSPILSVKEKNEGGKKTILYKQPKSVFNKAILKGSVLKLKSSLLNKKKGNSLLVSSSDSEPLPLDAGPRVKHVCRSKAQVLGMPRAVFPSPEFKQQQQQSSPSPVNDTVKRKLNLKKKASKFMSVLTPKGKRVLKKTIWCHKCPGCTTPNCKVCGNCLDMKKFGGPGTKKKPCVKRKCQNPLKAVKCGPEIDTSQFLDMEEEEECRKIVENHHSVPTFVNSELDVSDLPYENDCIERSEIDEEDLAVVVEGPIFVPKLKKPSCEPKDKGDIQMGKECIPGTRVNIDYWQEYDAEEMLTSGFPIITSVPLQIDSFCFRCGSAGLEQLLYCIWCCEGVHPFCLEEGEGPENDEEEFFWVCQKCAVCHVCGGSGHYDLLQCSGCRKHYHLECLGPTSHQSCQPTQEGVWVSDARRLLEFSWPKQSPLIRVCDPCVMLDSPGEESVTLLEHLENLDSFSSRKDGYLIEESSLLPSAVRRQGTLFSPDKKKNIIESVRIEDTFADLAEEDHICLEDAFEGLDEFIPPLPPTALPKEEEIINFFRNVNFYEQEDSEKNYYAKMEDDEYLCLKYKKILPFDQSPVETSLNDIVRGVHSEVFDFFGYPLTNHLKDSQIKDESFSSSSSTDLKSENPILDDTVDVDLKTAILIRRTGVQQAIKNLEELRIQEEKRIKEIERERLRLKRIESGKEGTEIIRKKLKYRRSSQVLVRELGESFVEYKDNASNQWQPKSWEEFDALFSSFQSKEEEDKTCNEENIFQTPRKRKRGRPCLTPGTKKARKLKLSQCSVKVKRIELKKFKIRKSLSPRKLPFKKLGSKSSSISLGAYSFFKAPTEDKENASKVEEEEDHKASTSDKESKISLSELEVEDISFQKLEDFTDTDTVVCNISSTSADDPLILQETEPMIVDGKNTDLEESLPQGETVIEISDQMTIDTDVSQVNLSINDKSSLEDDHKTPSENIDLENSSLSFSEDRPGMRSRRLKFGRASELASLRKAMMDM